MIFGGTNFKNVKRIPIGWEDNIPPPPASKLQSFGQLYLRSDVATEFLQYIATSISVGFSKNTMVLQDLGRRINAAVSDLTRSGNLDEKVRSMSRYSCIDTDR